MTHINVELKATTLAQDHNRIKNILESLESDYRGFDRQLDTYFKVKQGRLKLRQGTIENALIYYNRQDITGPKKSEVFLQEIHREEIEGLKNVLSLSLGILVEVSKKRDIHYIGNVKFHLDEVKGLGHFVEIEAIDKRGNIGLEHLTWQVQKYYSMFKMKQEDLISLSYSDLLLQKGL